MLDSDPRRDHYGEFYGLRELPSDARVAIVHGNCQAESVRIVVDGDDLVSVRIPPVFELTAADIPFLERLLGRVDVLVSQPVRDGYHDLPLGTRQLAAAAPGATVVMLPVVRFAGLYPYHVIIRPPSDTSLVPPLVDYHDLRVLAAAAARRSGRKPAPAPKLTVDQVVSIGADSIGELQKRELANDTITLSDLFEHPRFELMRTLNHPGNAVWAAAARRIRKRLALSENITDPGRQLLDSVHAPREEAVIDAYGLDDGPRPDWLVGKVPLSQEAVAEAHARWYEQHPDAVDAGLRRHARALAILGLSA